VSHNCFELEIENRIAHLGLLRPEALNVITLDFWGELPEIVERIAREAAARVSISSSTGPKPPPRSGRK